LNVRFERSFVPTTLERRASVMSFIMAKDGTDIYYKDWGAGPVVFFSYGWPLSADMWDGQMLFLTEHGFRTVAHDRITATHQEHVNSELLRFMES
jgi:hypothetical protein